MLPRESFRYPWISRLIVSPHKVRVNVVRIEVVMSSGVYKRITSMGRGVVSSMIYIVSPQQYGYFS